MSRRREFDLESVWVLAASRERVWEPIEDADSWIEWWPGLVEAVRTDDGAPDGSGQGGRFAWRAALGYTVRFEMVSTRVERPRLLEGEASGDLVGTGTWRLEEVTDGAADAACRVTFSWRVALAKRWIAPIAPALGPVLRWNHDRLMAAGARGLADRLGCELLPNRTPT
ncbi:hypothetical protein HJD18_16045 [Thermoleophilia bacterium SCSIO 60948]|nr:hypothetical protein HJD18_16045 [Thermoleophilia bacterium SCSIO 60948]